VWLCLRPGAGGADRAAERGARRGGGPSGHLGAGGCRGRAAGGALPAAAGRRTPTVYTRTGLPGIVAPESSTVFRVLEGISGSVVPGEKHHPARSLAYHLWWWLAETSLEQRRIGGSGSLAIRAPLTRCAWVTRTFQIVCKHLMCRSHPSEQRMRALQVRHQNVVYWTHPSDDLLHHPSAGRKSPLPGGRRADARVGRRERRAGRR
jgi:hypothetical protein